MPSVKLVFCVFFFVIVLCVIAPKEGFLLYGMSRRILSRLNIYIDGVHFNALSNILKIWRLKEKLLKYVKNDIEDISLWKNNQLPFTSCHHHEPMLLSDGSFEKSFNFGDELHLTIFFLSSNSLLDNEFPGIWIGRGELIYSDQLDRLI